MNNYLLDGIDPELIRAAELQPVVDYADPPAVRATLSKALKYSRALRAASSSENDIRVNDQRIPARENSPDIPIRVYDTVYRVTPSAALIFFHGGAFAAGDLETEDARCREIASRISILVISVDYRLAPEHPFPAGFQDCYDTLAWVAANADRIGVDPLRLAVGGSSAGGALAAAVALAAKDLGGPRIVFQLLLYPVIDDRMTTASMATFTATPGWNQPNSVHMWRHYLGEFTGNDVSPYAAPGRATDLSGLPPAYVLTAEFDPLRDEGIEYAARLIAADVPTELHQFPGAFHGFDVAAPNTSLARRSLNEQCAVLARAVGAVMDSQHRTDESRTADWNGPGSEGM